MSFQLNEGEHQLYFSLPRGSYIAEFSNNRNLERTKGPNIKVSGLNATFSIRNTYTEEFVIENVADHSVIFPISRSGRYRYHRFDIDLSFPDSEREYVYLNLRML